MLVFAGATDDTELVDGDEAADAVTVVAIDGAGEVVATIGRVGLAVSGSWC